MNLGADDELEILFFGSDMRPHHASETIPVCDPQRGVAMLASHGDQLVGV
jgi:hypothetical protein